MQPLSDENEDPLGIRPAASTNLLNEDCDCDTCVTGAFGNMQLASICLALRSFLFATARFAKQPATVVLAHDVGISASWYGVAILTMPLARLVANTPCAFLSEKYGRIPILQLSSISSGVCMVACGAITNKVGLSVSWMMFGLGQAAHMVGTNNVLADITTQEARSRTQACNRMGIFSGSLVGPLYAAAITARFGVQPVFYACLPLLGLAVMVTWLIPETLPKQIEPQHSSLCSRVAYSMETQWHLLEDKDMRCAMLVQFMHAFCTMAMSYNIIPQLCIRRFHMRVPQLSMMYAIGAASSLLGAPIFGLCTDKFGRKLSVTVGLGVMAASSLMLPCCTTALHVGAIFIPYNLAPSLALSGFAAYFADLYDHDPHKRTQSVTMQGNVFDLGEVLGSPLLGGLGALSLGYACCSQSLLLLAAGGVFGCFARETLHGCSEVSTD